MAGPLLPPFGVSDTLFVGVLCIADRDKEQFVRSAPVTTLYYNQLSSKGAKIRKTVPAKNGMPS